MSPPPDLFDETKARAVAWLTAWDSQGHHRTGTTGDETGALWLEHEAAGFGVDVATEAFTLKRLDPRLLSGAGWRAHFSRTCV